MQGKTVVITGATSGIGQVAALELAKAGARVVFTARNAMKGSDMLGRLRAANPSAAHALVVGDLMLIADMKSVAERIAIEAPVIDVLINNAGAFFQNIQKTSDGVERTFALNHLSYFVITEILRPHLAPDARIVSTASVGHKMGRPSFDDRQPVRPGAGAEAYATSKLANIVWTRELARRLAGTGVTANCFHPGGVNTGFAGDSTGVFGAIFSVIKPFMITPEKGADTLVWLASSPEVAGQTGGYWTKRKRVEPSAAARDPAAGPRLWAMSTRLSGVG